MHPNYHFMTFGTWATYLRPTSTRTGQACRKVWFNTEGRANLNGAYGRLKWLEIFGFMELRTGCVLLKQSETYSKNTFKQLKGTPVNNRRELLVLSASSGFFVELSLGRQYPFLGPVRSYFRHNAYDAYFRMQGSKGKYASEKRTIVMSTIISCSHEIQGKHIKLDASTSTFPHVI